MCLFVITQEGLSASQPQRMVSLLSGGTALAAGPNGKGEGGTEEGRERGRSVNHNQAAQHVRSWTRSTQCQPGMKAALTIPSWASGSGRERMSEAHNATHLGAQLRKTNASGHREGISG